MAPDKPAETQPEAELAENEAQKDSEVLGREGLEQELMQEDESPAGERIDEVEDE